jgi:hypothetical protein
MRIQRFDAAWQSLKAIEPTSRDLETLEPPGYVPSEADVARIEEAVRNAYIKRTCDFLKPNGTPVGERGTSAKIRLLPGGLTAAQRDFDYLSLGSDPIPFNNGWMARLPGDAGVITLRPTTSTPESPAVDVNMQGVVRRRLHYFGDE